MCRILHWVLHGGLLDFWRGGLLMVREGPCLTGGHRTHGDRSHSLLLFHLNYVLVKSPIVDYTTARSLLPAAGGRVQKGVAAELM